MRAFHSPNGIQHKNDIIHSNVNQRRDHKQAIKCNGFSEDESQQIIIIIAIIIIINMVLDSNVRTRAKHPLNELYYNHSVGRFPHLAFPLEIEKEEKYKKGHAISPLSLALEHIHSTFKFSASHSISFLCEFMHANDFLSITASDNDMTTDQMLREQPTTEFCAHHMPHEFIYFFSSLIFPPPTSRERTVTFYSLAHVWENSFLLFFSSSSSLLFVPLAFNFCPISQSVSI